VPAGQQADAPSDARPAACYASKNVSVHETGKTCRHEGVEMQARSPVAGSAMPQRQCPANSYRVMFRRKAMHGKPRPENHSGMQAASGCR